MSKISYAILLALMLAFTVQAAQYLPPPSHLAQAGQVKGVPADIEQLAPADSGPIDPRLVRNLPMIQ